MADQAALSPRSMVPANSIIDTGGQDPQSPAPKAVTIFEEPEHIPNDVPTAVPAQSSPKLHRASISGKKMTGRSLASQNSLPVALTRTISSLKLEDSAEAEAPVSDDASTGRGDVHNLLTQVREWLGEEKLKRRKQKLAGRDLPPQIDGSADTEPKANDINPDSDVGLEKLESILDTFTTSSSIASDPKPKKSYSGSRRGSLAKVFKRHAAPPASSDTEWAGEDINVPHVEAFLDNVKTLAISASAAESKDAETGQQKENKHWKQFKQDIVRLTHTLKIRGWRRIPIKEGSVISVERLSGALTNAVYVVKPPKELPVPDETDDSKPYVSKSRPTELLLRVYGPQVEHLIDRNRELNILRRLARKRIGPRLLGTFTNGRFEEYLHAKTLEAEDVRIPDTSKQIAKRMRELHDGIELLPSEREDGPLVFQNWDNWVDRCEKIITWLDMQVKREAEGHKPASKRYTRRGFICGVEWSFFRETFDKYRAELITQCGGTKALQRRLVFSHNDTQYGNLMRLSPPGESPLLQPANQHRQLVVIDFEYAGANAPGYEFADHFSEWCYDYHQSVGTYACNTNRYPSVEEQRRFLRSYVMHRPQFSASASSTPKMEAREKTNISDFMLDARAPLEPPAIDYTAEEKAREEKQEFEIQLLIHETRLWRVVNAAQWVAWGIIQAKVPELDDPPKKSKTSKVTEVLDRVREHIHPVSDPLDEDVQAHQKAAKVDSPEARLQEEIHDEDGGEQEDGEDFEEEFDCLAYSNDRAMLFWGDCLQMGIVREADLPESLLKQIKILKY